MANESLTASVGALVAAAMAVAGRSPILMGGRTMCETDYLAASGATFPASVTYEQMVDFNRRTLRPEMDETDEMARYAAIAEFFNRRSA